MSKFNALYKINKTIYHNKIIEDWQPTGLRILYKFMYFRELEKVPKLANYIFFNVSFSFKFNY